MTTQESAQDVTISFGVVGRAPVLEDAAQGMELIGLEQSGRHGALIKSLD